MTNLKNSKLNSDQKEYLIILIQKRNPELENIASVENNDQIKSFLENLSLDDQLQILNKFVEKYSEFETYRDSFVEASTACRFNLFFSLFSLF